MKYKKVLVFAGTYEARMLCEHLNKLKVNATCCVATEYGLDFLTALKNLEILCNRLTEKEIIALIDKKSFEVVIDATHPYAAVVTQNIIAACTKTNTNYIRLLRPEGQCDNAFTADNPLQAVEYLKNTKGNILLTTGSKDLKEYCTLPDFQQRLFARVLSSSNSIKECEELGLKGKNIIAMQGPFSKEFNIAMLEQFKCKYLVTKNTGNAGGFEDKIAAAQTVGVKIVLIGRPLKETGYSLKEVLALFKK